MNALQIAATGMAAQQMRVDVISNNLANMSTTAYNARRADFADLQYRQIASLQRIIHQINLIGEYPWMSAHYPVADFSV